MSKKKLKIVIAISIFALYFISYFLLRDYQLETTEAKETWHAIRYDSVHGRSYPANSLAEKSLIKLREVGGDEFFVINSMYIGSKGPYRVFIPAEWLEISFR